jgi:raffinose/stachyose/melibiose transport system permease protein
MIEMVNDAAQVPGLRAARSTARRRTSSRRRRASPLARWWWALPGVIIVVGVHYVATAVGGFFAFTDWSGLGSFDFIGLANFERILANPREAGAVRNTIFLAVGALIITQVVGLALALGLNRGLRTRHILRVLLFMPAVLSPLAVSYVWQFIFDYTGPLNGLLSAVGLEHLVRAWLGDTVLAIWMVLIVMCWQSTGITMVIYMAGLAGVPLEIEEAAAIDGASLWQRFWHVVLPSLRPAVAISSTLMIIQGLRTFDEVMGLTGGGPAGATETLATSVYKQSFALGQFGYGAALAIVLTLLILLFAVTQQRLTNGRGRES